jgi:hypothetical protein
VNAALHPYSGDLRFPGANTPGDWHDTEIEMATKLPLAAALLALGVLAGPSAAISAPAVQLPALSLTQNGDGMVQTVQWWGWRHCRAWRDQCAERWGWRTHRFWSCVRRHGC